MSFGACQSIFNLRVQTTRINLELDSYMSKEDRQRHNTSSSKQTLHHRSTSGVYAERLYKSRQLEPFDVGVDTVLDKIKDVTS